MDFSTIIANIVAVILSPLQLILIPVDKLLSQIPGIGIIPASISSITGFVGSLPSTVVSLLGVSPILWNAVISVFLLNFTLLPSIQLLKKIWAWIRL